MFAVISFALLGFLGIGPRTGRYSTLTVLSGSMRPAIPIGAVIVDTPEPASALRVGQIVTYAMPIADHHVVTHRVVRIIGGTAHPSFQTKGDANDAADPWQAQITSAEVWRVRAVVPRLGFVIRWLRNPAMRVLGVAVLPAALAMWWAVSIWRQEDDAGNDASDGAS
jgi:signal peptidase